MPTDPAPPARELAAIIRDEIARTGAMPWARFMELALYQPEHGYYERATQNIGRRGDFFTSVSVGPLFGELLAAQFSEWLDELPPPPAGGPLQLVEAGAHNGQLAHDVLAWFQCQRPDQFAALEILRPRTLAAATSVAGGNAPRVRGQGAVVSRVGGNARAGH